MVPPPITFDRVNEIQKVFMNPARGIAESWIHKNFKVSSTLSKVMRGGGEGGGAVHSTSALYSVKLCI